LVTRVTEVRASRKEKLWHRGWEAATKQRDKRVASVGVANQRKKVSRRGAENAEGRHWTRQNVMWNSSLRGPFSRVWGWGDRRGMAGAGPLPFRRRRGCAGAGEGCRPERRR